MAHPVLMAFEYFVSIYGSRYSVIPVCVNPYEPEEKSYWDVKNEYNLFDAVYLFYVINDTVISLMCNLQSIHFRTSF